MKNLYLYQLLVRVFGSVKVSNLGCSNEHYRVCCPFCGDRRYRLYFRWDYHLDRGRVDTRFRHSRQVWCHNEELCMADPENVSRLRDMLLGHADSVRAVAPVCEPDLDRGAAVEWPISGSVSIASLASDHPAVVWLRSRRFDPYVVAKTYDLYYGHEIGPYYHRVIIPILDLKTQVVGFQARALDDAAELKYLSSDYLPRAGLLYNLSTASRHSTVVVVEGPVDVWRVGPCSVASLGMLSSRQVSLLTSLTGKTIVLAYDGDVWSNPATKRRIESCADVLRFRFGGRVVVVKLEKDRDPADYSSEEFWSVVVKQAQQQGIELDLRESCPLGCRGNARSGS